MKRLNEIEFKVLETYLDNIKAIETIELKLKPLNEELKRLKAENKVIEETGELRPRDKYEARYCSEDIPF